MNQVAVPIVVLLLSVATLARGQAASVGVRDGGNFFSAETEQKATSALGEIGQKFGGAQVLVETFNEPPDGQAAREFAAKRAREGNPNALHVLIARKGGQVAVAPGEGLKGAFTPEASDRLRNSLTSGLRKGTQNFDATLLQGVAEIREVFERSKPAGGDAVAAAAGGPRAKRSRTEQIFDALSSDVPELRKAAADVLRGAASDRPTAEAAVPRLVEMLRGRDAGARLQAIELLGEIGKGQAELIRPALGPLVDALRDVTSNEVRRAAARALGSAGPAAREAAAGPLKTAAENDADGGVRQEAAASLKAIGG